MYKIVGFVILVACITNASCANWTIIDNAVKSGIN